MALKVLSIPIDSISSLVILIPAVSISLKLTPLMVKLSSIVSRVVPGIWETIARSSSRSAFNNVDFPTLGLPIMATGIPFLITFPSLKESVNRVTSDFNSVSKLRIFDRSANSTSSSLKSSSSSRREANSTN